MNIDFTLNKKNIIKDPITIFTNVYGISSTNKKIQLEQLWLQYKKLKLQHTDYHIRGKKLSREIGVARSDNQNIDTLIISMQNISQRLKQLSQQLTELENNILSYFDINDFQSETNNAATTGLENASRHHISNVMDINEISVKQLTDKHTEWNDYVTKNPVGCIHHRSEWISLFKKSYGHECHYLYAQNNKNNIVGVLPLVRLNSRLFGNFLVSMPFFQRAGAIADHPLIEDKLIHKANQLAKELGIDHIEYRDDIARTNMPAQSHKVNMLLTLPDTTDLLWRSFSSKLRSQIRRPQRENTETMIGHEELLNDFYTVYTRNMRDLGSPAHSKNFIANILEKFPDNSWLVVIRLNDKPVSAGFLLGYGGTLEIPLASTIKEVNSLSINMLLYWEILQFAINKKYQEFDFGRSSKGAGTYNFKKQWGAKPKQLYWHYWLGKTTTIPSMNPSNPKYKLMINIWKRLPLFLTTTLGPLFVKNIP